MNAYLFCMYAQGRVCGNKIVRARVCMFMRVTL